MFTVEQIQKLTRSEIRYALFRSRSGNPETDHNEILSFYSQRLEKYNLPISEFGENWDISPENNADIVSGHVVYMLQKENSTLFDEEGNEKNPILNK